MHSIQVVTVSQLLRLLACNPGHEERRVGTAPSRLDHDRLVLACQRERLDVVSQAVADLDLDRHMPDHFGPGSSDTSNSRFALSGTIPKSSGTKNG